MSSELRLKKLRASGGYIMAKVTDEQQAKGNLGGPDLFLAPIGKIDESLITKYYCNTCDKEFEGAPKMEFESPNEEVAENLILINRGQYVCASCNGALAEVREFKKSDESMDIGNAKPLESTPQTSVPNVQSTVVPDVSNAVQDVATREMTVQSSVQDVPNVQDVSSQETIVSANVTKGESSLSHATAVRSIEGRTVYDHDANKVGIAKQIGIDATQSMVLVITGSDGTEFNIPWSNIKKVGEVIFLNEQSTGHVDSNKCTSCGFVNKEGSKFCEECGANIQS